MNFKVRRLSQISNVLSARLGLADKVNELQVITKLVVIPRYKQCSNNEESIMLFARTWNDKRICIFTVYKQVIRLCCWAAMGAMRLHFCLLSLIFLTWLSWHWYVILPVWLLTLESTSFIHSHCTNSAFHVLCHHFSFVILPLKVILVQMPLDLPCHYTFYV